MKLNLFLVSYSILNKKTILAHSNPSGFWTSQLALRLPMKRGIIISSSVFLISVFLLWKRTYYCNFLYDKLMCLKRDIKKDRARKQLMHPVECRGGWSRPRMVAGFREVGECDRSDEQSHPECGWGIRPRGRRSPAH